MLSKLINYFIIDFGGAGIQQSLNLKGIKSRAEKTYAEQENVIEEILKDKSDLIFDDEESMIIVDRQVKNEMQGRRDFTAVDSNGNFVLIEIKRDPTNIENKKEAS